jgi:hypothetical protein
MENLLGYLATVDRGAALISGLFFCGAWYFWRRSRRFIRESLQTSGEVIEIEVTDSHIDDNGTSYAPIVRYTAKDGVTREFTGGTMDSFEHFSIGDVVGVRYHRQDYANARVDTKASIYNVAIFLCLVGMFIFIGGVIVPVW